MKQEELKYKDRMVQYSKYLLSDEHSNANDHTKYWTEVLMNYTRSIRMADTYKELDEALKKMFGNINNNFSSPVWGGLEKASNILRRLWKESGVE